MIFKTTIFNWCISVTTIWNNKGLNLDVYSNTRIFCWHSCIKLIFLIHSVSLFWIVSFSTVKVSEDLHHNFKTKCFWWQVLLQILKITNNSKWNVWEVIGWEVILLDQVPLCGVHDMSDKLVSWRYANWQNQNDIDYYSSD